jgi:Zn-dependent protease with chaperone function
MKKVSYLIAGASTLALPLFASAQLADGAGGGPLETFLVATATFINDIAIPFLMALAFLVFIWGVFQFFIAGGSDEEKREKGKSLMIYAVLGFVMIIILYGLVNFFAQTLGLEGETILVPQVPTTRGA